MNLRFALFNAALAGLSLVAPGFAAPPSAPVPKADTPAVAVVREFLADRAAGKYTAAYALLSANSQQTTSLMSIERGDPTAAHDFQGWPAPALGLLVFFFDTHNTLNYTFTVIGPDPLDPNSVLVRAMSPAGAAAGSAATLRLLTVFDPVTHTVRLEVLGAVQRAAPEAFAAEREKAQEVTSQSNLKQLALGVIQYTQDHDERMPDADQWVDEIMPYVKTEAVFHDPAASAGKKWSYAYNQALSGIKFGEVDYPAHTVLLFESTTGLKNASDTGQSVPVPGRHLGGTDYALADGHVKWERDGTKLSYRLDGK